MVAMAHAMRVRLPKIRASTLDMAARARLFFRRAGAADGGAEQECDENENTAVERTHGCLPERE